MERRRPVTAVLALLAALLLAPAVRAAGPPSPGEPARPFTLPDLEGRQVSLASFKGSLVLLHFWATWCPTCRQEMSLLEEAARAHQKGFVILGVNLGEKRGRVASYVEAAGITFPVLLDGRGKVASAYDVLSLPITLVVAPDGRVADRVRMGSLDREGLEEIVRRHLPE